MSRDEQAKSGGEKDLSNQNYDNKGEDTGNKLYTFKVVANAGDPGLTEDEHFDILSRFVICELQSANRVPTNHQYQKMYFLVKRPDHLWISCEKVGDSSSNYQDSRRKDHSGNVNVGKAGNPSIKTIPSIDQPYGLGQVITAKKIPRMEIPETSGFFTSAFPYSWGGADFKDIYSGGKDKIIGNPDTPCKYSQDYWNHHGTASSYTVSQGKVYDEAGRLVKTNSSYTATVKQLKPLYPADNTYRGPIRKGQPPNDRFYDFPLGQYSYWMILHYYLVHYSLGVCNREQATIVEQLRNHNQKYQGNGQHYCKGRNLPSGGVATQAACVSNGGTWIPYAPIINQKGGFIGQNIILSNVQYEDTNVENRQRKEVNECMPLVIASPNQFPTPKSRQTGAIVYEPTYSTVASAQSPSSATTEASTENLEIRTKITVINNGGNQQRDTGWVNSSVIQTNMDKLNTLFGGTGISFVWGGVVNSVVVPTGTYYNQGDNAAKSLQPAIEPESHLNFWIIPCGATGNNCGSWATFPASHGNSDDGVVMSVSNIIGGWSSNYSLGNIWAHEVGHYLGLYHIWGDGDCSRDDGIDDTPLQDGPTFGCPEPAPMACDGTTPVMVNNFMNYSDDACTSNFTQGQIDRMQATIAGPRKSLIGL